MRLKHAAVVLLLGGTIAACGHEDTSASAPRQPIAILSAFPAEMAAVLARTTVDHTEVIGTRTFRVGTIGGSPVIVGMTGIGLVNAADTTRALLDAESLSGIIFSGVAGSPARIADVVAPEVWVTAEGDAYPVAEDWLALAREVATTASGHFERCTIVTTPPRGEVCLGFEPTLTIGGVGESDDPFGGVAQPCRPGAGDVFGCDVGETIAALRRARVAAEEPIVSDMESAAVAEIAAERGVRFIGFRGVSDGTDDPLGLPGFPAQFFAYYRLAAANAANAAAAFVSARP